MAHSRRHCLRKNLVKRLHRLTVAVAGRGRAVDLRARIFVIVHDEFGAGAVLDLCERRERNGLPLIVANVKLQEILCTGAIFIVSLHIDLPLPPETVEVIHKIPAHEGLQRGVNVAERNTQFQHFVTVHFDKYLRHTRQIGRKQSSDFGTFPRGGHEPSQVLREK